MQILSSKTKKIILTFISLLFISGVIISQEIPEEHLQILEDYEKYAAFSRIDKSHDTLYISKFLNLFYSKNAPVYNDVGKFISESDINKPNDHKPQYIEISDYIEKNKYEFNGDLKVRLFDIKQINTRYYKKGYFIIDLVAEKNIKGLTNSNIFIPNKSVDLIFSVARIPGKDKDNYKILKIENTEIKLPEQFMFSELNTYFSPGIAMLRFNNNSISENENYSGNSITNKFSYRIGIDLSLPVIFKKNYGINLGLGLAFARYKSTLNTNIYQTTNPDVGIVSNDDEKLLECTDVKQNIILNYIEVPLFMQFDYNLNRATIYVKTGFVFGFNTGSTYVNTDGSIYYKRKHSNVVNDVENTFIKKSNLHYGFDEYKIEENTHTLDVTSTNLSGLLSAGFYFPITKYWSIKSGADYIIGFSNIYSNKENQLTSNEGSFNKLLSPASTIRTGMLSFNIGLAYNFKRAQSANAKKITHKEIKKSISGYSPIKRISEKEKTETGVTNTDFSGLNLIYLDLSSDSLDRRNAKKTYLELLQNIERNSGSYLIYLSNMDNPDIAELNGSYDHITDQFFQIDPYLPDIRTDFGNLKELIEKLKLDEIKKVNFFLFLSYDFHNQSEDFIKKLQELFVKKDIEVYILLDHTFNGKKNLQQTNHNFYNINKQD